MSSGVTGSSDMSAVKVSGQPGLRLEVERNMNMVMYAAYCGFIVGAVIFFLCSQSKYLTLLSCRFQFLIASIILNVEAFLECRFIFLSSEGDAVIQFDLVSYLVWYLISCCYLKPRWRRGWRSTQ